MNTAKGAQAVSHGGPHTLGRVEMHFADAISIVVTRPLLLAVTDGRMHLEDMSVALPLIREHHSLCQSGSVHVFHQRFLIRVVNHSQACLSTPCLTVPTIGRPIVAVCAVLSPFAHTCRNKRTCNLMLATHE
jgi:hypothetical protein